LYRICEKQIDGITAGEGKKKGMGKSQWDWNMGTLHFEYPGILLRKNAGN
jgi:hypothetical protein